MPPQTPTQVATRPAVRGRSPSSSPHPHWSPERVITVAHTVWQLACGGLERQMLQILNCLASKAFHHRIVVRSADRPVLHEPVAPAGNIRIVSGGTEGRNRRWACRLAGILRKQAADVLHVRGLTMLPDAVLAARLAGSIPVAFSFHGFESYPPRLSWMRKQLYKVAVRACAARWAVGPSAARALASTLGLSSFEVDVIPNGVDGDIFRPAVNRDPIRLRLGLPVDRLVALCVGNLKPVKGHEVLLKAIGGLGTAQRTLTLVLVGEDFQGGRLQRLAERLPRQVEARFVGRQDDPLPWYQAADLFVLPSRWEGMSNALLEAMACGLPVIATRVGGNVDLVNHEETGLMVPPENPTELSQAIARLRSDDELRRRLGAAARSHVLRFHDLRRTADHYSEQYARLVGAGSRGGRESAAASLAEALL